MERFQSAFIEHREFLAKTPWYVLRMNFDVPSITPPHYAETIEICRYHHVKGIVYVNNQSIELYEDLTLFIPPYSIHAMDYGIGDGYADIIKLEPKALFKYVDIPEQYRASGLDLYSIPCELPADISQELAEVIHVNSSSILDICTAISRFFREAAKYVPESSNGLPAFNVKQNEAIRKIITWTEENYGTDISLEQVAKQFHYSKHYFCAKFKKETDVSYWDYLHSVRIYHACRMLRSGMTISQVSERCGYTSVSYFIQLFKKMMKVTPKQYLSKFQIYEETDMEPS